MTIAQSMLPEFEMEMANTRKLLELVPEDKWDWKIHDKSNTIGWVANHLADIPSWVDMTISHDSFDVEPADGEAYRVPSESTVRAVLERFDRNIDRARQLLESVDDETLLGNWSLLQKGEVLMTMPRLACLRMWILNHSIHHRAHLCVYLRVNDVAVPGMYGPSADAAPM
jgi:uncharacterized damage-inducible protein DinB